MKPKKKRKSKKLWYWYGTTAYFGGIKEVEIHIDNYHDEGNESCPFKTFIEAKNDAIDYFRVDIREARRCINEIKETKKGD